MTRYDKEIPNFFREKVLNLLEEFKTKERIVISHWEKFPADHEQERKLYFKIVYNFESLLNAIEVWRECPMTSYQYEIFSGNILALSMFSVAGQTHFPENLDNFQEENYKMLRKVAAEKNVHSIGEEK